MEGCLDPTRQCHCGAWQPKGSWEKSENLWGLSALPSLASVVPRTRMFVFSTPIMKQLALSLSHTHSAECLTFTDDWFTNFINNFFSLLYDENLLLIATFFENSLSQREQHISISISHLIAILDRLHNIFSASLHKNRIRNRLKSYRTFTHHYINISPPFTSPSVTIMGCPKP